MSKEQTDREFIESIAIKMINRINYGEKSEPSTYVDVGEDDIKIGIYIHEDEQSKILESMIGKIEDPKPFLDVVWESCVEMTHEEQVEHKANIVKHLRRYADEIDSWEVTPG